MSSLTDDEIAYKQIKINCIGIKWKVGHQIGTIVTRQNIIHGLEWVLRLAGSRSDVYDFGGSVSFVAGSRLCYKSNWAYKIYGTLVYKYL